MDEGKYKVPKDEGEVLPNIPGFTKTEEIEQAELEGFLYAYKILFAELNEKTKFDLKYIYLLHKLALEHLYSFAGKLRTVNISKGGFMFPPAKFLEQTMNDFEKNILSALLSQYDSEELLIKDIAKFMQSSCSFIRFVRVTEELQGCWQTSWLPRRGTNYWSLKTSGKKNLMIM